MSKKTAKKQEIVECSFLVPYSPNADNSLERYLRARLTQFVTGFIEETAVLRGRLFDESGNVHDAAFTRFVVAVPASEVNKVRSVLRDIFASFNQPWIYFKTGHNVEFVR